MQTSNPPQEDKMMQSADVRHEINQILLKKKKKKKNTINDQKIIIK